MMSRRNRVRLGVSAALAAGAMVLSAGSASAAPAFDPNGDGNVTVDEVLDAPLVPTSVVPEGSTFDANGDGALSVGEVFGQRLGRGFDGTGIRPGCEGTPRNPSGPCAPIRIGYL
ncbi:MAG: hypothetical protein ACOH2Q_05755 [Rhodococcus sp. (in: high G+C Gram-positive bacteria)]